MERLFDLLSDSDRLELAEHLPTFDGRTLDFDAQTFVDGLRHVSKYLGDPGWLVYQYGTVGPLRQANHQFFLELRRIVTLTLELHELVRHPGFTKLIEGLRNVPQFFDTLFEIQVALVFSRSEATARLEFSSEHLVRGHLKRPEFDAETSIGKLSVECKRSHILVQQAVCRFNMLSLLRAGPQPRERIDECDTSAV